MESDSVVFDVEVGRDDLAANSALARLQRLLQDCEDEGGLRMAEH
jgi:hypothetical protein